MRGVPIKRAPCAPSKRPILGVKRAFLLLAGNNKTTGARDLPHNKNHPTIVPPKRLAGGEIERSSSGLFPFLSAPLVLAGTQARTSAPCPPSL